MNFESQPWDISPSRVRTHWWIMIRSRAVYNMNMNLLDFDIRLDTRGGHWLMLFDNYLHEDCIFTELDLAWKKVCELVRGGVIIQALCSTSKMNPTIQDCGEIRCYTEDYTDKETVRETAEQLRLALHYPYILIYRINEKKDWMLGDKDFEYYLHLENNELYERNFFVADQYRWKLVTNFGNQLWLAVPSEIKESEWILIRSRAVFLGNISDFDHDLTISGGHWLLYFDNRSRNKRGSTELDVAWFRIRGLIWSDVIIQAKCSTSVFNPIYQDRGVIMCYTPDYSDKEYIRRIAEQIRGVIYYKDTMGYKLNEKKNWMLSEQDLELYNHNVDNELYECNFSSYPRSWILVPRNPTEKEFQTYFPQSMYFSSLGNSNIFIWHYMYATGSSTQWHPGNIEYLLQSLS